MDHELWERLIAGDCTRILVISHDPFRSMIAIYLPQTLGLPPMVAHNYQWYPDGERRPDTELPALAEELAQDERWIAEGPAWAVEFMPRAEVILSIETAYIGLSTELPRSVKNPANLRRLVGERLRHFSRKPAEGTWLDEALDVPNHVAAAAWNARTVAEEQFGEKLIRVTSHSEVRQLQKVRARR